MTSIIQATEFTGLIIGIGGAGAVLYKGASALRRFGHFIDKLAGNGDSEPGVLARLAELKDVVADLAAGQVILTQSQDEVKRKLDQHCDGDAVQWKAEGEVWGHRLDQQVADLDHRVAKLENQDPLTRPPAAGSIAP